MSRNIYTISSSRSLKGSKHNKKGSKRHRRNLGEFKQNEKRIAVNYCAQHSFNSLAYSGFSDRSKQGFFEIFQRACPEAARQLVQVMMHLTGGDHYEINTEEPKTMRARKEAATGIAFASGVDRSRSESSIITRKGFKIPLGNEKNSIHENLDQIMKASHEL